MNIINQTDKLRSILMFGRFLRLGFNEQCPWIRQQEEEKQVAYRFTA